MGNEDVFVLLDVMYCRLFGCVKIIFKYGVQHIYSGL